MFFHTRCVCVRVCVCVCVCVVVGDGGGQIYFKIKQMGVGGGGGEESANVAPIVDKLFKKIKQILIENTGYTPNFRL